MSIYRLPLVINGVDFSEAADRTGYAIEYEERNGPNGFMSIAGTQSLDFLRRVPVIYWPLNALWLDEMRQLRTYALNAPYVPVSYLDLDFPDIQSGYFHATFGRVSVPLITQTGSMVKDGTVLTLRGR